MQPSIAHRINDGQVTGLFVPACSQNHGKEVKIEKNKAFWTIMKKANLLARFID